MADGNSYIYKALGLEYDEEQKAWMWKEKPVYAIWFGDAGMIIYGDVKPEGENCLHITWESGDGTATFKVFYLIYHCQESIGKPITSPPPR